MYPLATNFTYPWQVFTYANLVTGNWFWSVILLGLYIIVYISLSYTTTTMRAFTVTGTFGGFIATFMYAMTWIQEPTWIITMVVAVTSFMMLLFSHGQNE